MAFSRRDESRPYQQQLKYIPTDHNVGCSVLSGLRQYGSSEHMDRWVAWSLVTKKLRSPEQYKHTQAHLNVSRTAMTQ